MNVANTLPALEAPETGPHAMKFTYSSGDRPLEGYTIKRGVGHGGFGEVYYAVSDGGKEVALKLVQHNLEVELRGVGQCLNVKHANLVALYDVRQNDDSECWIVMEYMSGTSLDRLIDKYPTGMPPEEATRWLRGIAAGVDYLHERGIVHRDLKPGNLFVEDGHVKIGDYGLAKFVSVSRRSGNTESVGTVHYMAPELAQGRYSKEIDLYALGIIFYEMLTGQVPFDGESVGEILMKHLTAQPDLSRLPAEYRPVVGRLLAKDPGQRYASAQAMLQDLDPRTGVAAPAYAPDAQPGAVLESPAARTPGWQKQVGGHWREGAGRRCHRSGPAKLLGIGVGFFLFGWALAGGIPEASVFLALGGGLLAGALARYIPLFAHTPDPAARKIGKTIGVGIGFFVFGWALAGLGDGGSVFLGLGAGFLAALLPYLTVAKRLVTACASVAHETRGLVGFGAGVLVFGGALAGGCDEASLFLAIGAGMLASVVIPAFPALIGRGRRAPVPAPGAPPAIAPGTPNGPADVTRDYGAQAPDVPPVEPPADAAGPHSETAQKHGRPIRKLVKFLVWTVMLGFVFVLFASILSVVGAWMLFSPTIHANREGVEEMTRGITEIKVLKGLEPQFAAGEKLLGTRLAVYSDPEYGDEGRFLVLMAFPHGKKHLPESLQSWLEEEMAVVRPARRRIVDGGKSESREWHPTLPGVSWPEIAVEVQDKIRIEVDRQLGHLDDFASEDDELREYEIRGASETVTIRKGRDSGKQVVRVFAPFEAKGDKPALLVFGTTEERWKESDSKDFEAMLESMKRAERQHSTGAR